MYFFILIGTQKTIEVKKLKFLDFFGRGQQADDFY